MLHGFEDVLRNAEKKIVFLFMRVHESPWKNRQKSWTESEKSTFLSRVWWCRINEFEVWSGGKNVWGFRFSFCVCLRRLRSR